MNNSTRLSFGYLALLWVSLCSFALAIPSPSDHDDRHGSTRKFQLTLTWEKGAPDGVERKMFKINGKFPGPLLEINEGENVAIYVKNDSPYNTTVHYHGTAYWLWLSNWSADSFRYWNGGYALVWWCTWPVTETYPTRMWLYIRMEGNSAWNLLLPQPLGQSNKWWPVWANSHPSKETDT